MTSGAQLSSFSIEPRDELRADALLAATETDDGWSLTDFLRAMGTDAHVFQLFTTPGGDIAPPYREAPIEWAESPFTKDRRMPLASVAEADFDSSPESRPTKRKYQPNPERPLCPGGCGRALRKNSGEYCSRCRVKRSTPTAGAPTTPVVTTATVEAPVPPGMPDPSTLPLEYLSACVRELARRVDHFRTLLG